MSITHYTVLSTDRGAHSVADSCHCHAHQTGGGSPLSPGPFSFLTPRRRGRGGRWTSLHESTSVCPPLLISSQPHAQTLPLTYSALSLCTFQKHTHTSTRSLSCTTHPHKHKNIIFFALSTPAAQDHFSLSTFLLDTDTVKIIALCTIGSDPFMYLETHYVLPMCRAAASHVGALSITPL